jgi:ATP-dependent Zn protease
LIPAHNAVNQVNNNIEPNLNETQVILNNQQEQVPVFNNNNDNNGVDLRGEEREDDWLTILYNFFSFLLLFCIVYLYSTLTRFIIVVFVITLLYL